MKQEPIAQKNTATHEKRPEEALREFLSRSYSLSITDTLDVVSFVRLLQAGAAAREALAGEPAQLFSPSQVLEKARLEGEIQHGIFQEPLVAPTEAGSLAGSKSSTNLRQYAGKLRRKGVLLGIPHGNSHLYPLFQFDLEKHRVQPVVKEVNAMLFAYEDPWGVASWWFTEHEILGGARPVDLLATEDESTLIVAVKADTAPVG